ncbi:EAL domain-containing protein [Kineococcus sp. TBRC 1896]|uniref:EAL domain-containing protein n=1 Tax=Kineococcus mangrovi TaxID=1660183 RepID=A0ABV4HYG0_9ACTN
MQRPGHLASSTASRTSRQRSATFVRYQPIVTLSAPLDRHVVAVEALTGAPVHAVVEDDGRAERDGLVADDLRRLRAVVADLTALPAPGARLLPVFVNLEPVSLSMLTPATVHQLLHPLLQRTSVVVEVTERSLLHDPAGLLRGIRHLRQAGCAIAVDDVGSTPAALALLSLIEPDVVKLDMGLLHDPFTPSAAATVAAVRDQADRTGALVLAEGIETRQQEQKALSTGADLGQGWRYGRSLGWPPVSAATDGASPLETALQAARRNLAVSSRHYRSPFAVLSQTHTVRRGSQRLLTQMSRHLEDQALNNTADAVVLAALTTPAALHGLTRRRFEALGRTATFTAVSAPGMPRRPCHGVVGQPLNPLSPIAGEWVMTVLTPFFAGMLAARPVPRPGDEARRGQSPCDDYDYAVSYDRAEVVQASRCLVRELDPLPLAVDHGRRSPAGEVSPRLDAER